MSKSLRNSLLEAHEDIKAYLAGDLSRGKVQKIRVPDDIDVKAVREKMNLSQKEFAEMFGFKLQTLQSWERKRNRRKPTETARLFLTVLQKRPEVVMEALVEHRR